MEALVHFLQSILTTLAIVNLAPMVFHVEDEEEVLHYQETICIFIYKKDLGCDIINLL